MLGSRVRAPEGVQKRETKVSRFFVLCGFGKGYALCSKGSRGSACKPATSTTFATLPMVVCQNHIKRVVPSANSNLGRVTSVVLPHRHKWRLRHSLGEVASNLRAPEGVRRTEITTISVLFSYKYAWFGGVPWRNWVKTNLSATFVEPMLNQKKNCVNQNLACLANVRIYIFCNFTT